MKIRITAIAAVTAVAALAVAASGFAAVRTTKVTPTHPGVPAANMVTLRGVTGASTHAYSFIRAGADGVTTIDYTVPVGMALVITDVSWYSRLTGTQGTAGAFGILSRYLVG
jgi:hypothetical protein